LMDNVNFSTLSLSANPEFNFLNKILDISDNEHDFDFNDSPYETTNITCEYIDPTSYASTFKNLHEISLMSFNVQSLSAKFSEFKDMTQLLMNANCAPDVICLQEIWQIPSHANFSLLNTKPDQIMCREEGLAFTFDQIYLTRFQMHIHSSLILFLNPYLLS
jgi:hypothetical protein